MILTSHSPIISHRSLNDRLDPFGGQNSYLRVPGGHSGRTSPSVASNTSEPESCIDDRYQDDDDVDIGKKTRESLSLNRVHE
nr:unnamed protein product [Haemonchus contortus]